MMPSPSRVYQKCLLCTNQSFIFVQHHLQLLGNKTSPAPSNTFLLPPWGRHWCSCGWVLWYIRALVWLRSNCGFFNYFFLHKGSGVNMLEAWEPLVSAAVTLTHLHLDCIPTTTLITWNTQRKKETNIKKYRACLLPSFNFTFPSGATMAVDLICV